MDIIHRLKDEGVGGRATGAYAQRRGAEWGAVELGAPVKDVKDMLEGTAKATAAWRKYPGDRLSGSPPTEQLLLPAAGGQEWRQRPEEVGRSAGSRDRRYRGTRQMSSLGGHQPRPAILADAGSGRSRPRPGRGRCAVTIDGAAVVWSTQRVARWRSDAG